MELVPAIPALSLYVCGTLFDWSEGYDKKNEYSGKDLTSRNPFLFKVLVTPRRDLTLLHLCDSEILWRQTFLK